MFVERKRERISHIVHVSTAVRRWQCLQRLDVRHFALSSIRQGLRDNIREVIIRSGPSARIWVSDVGE